MKYLLDSNTFIEAKNRYYSMKVCPGYWQWILMSHEKMGVASIDFVRDELKAGNDELAEWAEVNKKLFLKIDDDATQEQYVKVANYVMTLNSLKPHAPSDFLRGADPWLVAKALVTGATIVTHEKLDPHIKKKVLIPNVCEYFGVNYINTFDLLHQLDAEFIMPVSA